MKQTIAVILVLVLLACSLCGCTSKYYKDAAAAAEKFNASAEKANQLIQENNEKLEAILSANKDLDDAIAAAVSLTEQDRLPASNDALMNLYDAVNQARKARKGDPKAEPTPLIELLEATEEMDDATLQAVIAAAGEKISVELVSLPDVPDYSAELSVLRQASDDYTASLKEGSVPLKPDEEYIIGKLQTLPTFKSYAQVDKAHDPNGLLGKEGGYTGCVYYIDTRVNTRSLRSKYGSRINDPLSMGTEGGGAVEIFPSVEEALKRGEFLAGYEGYGAGHITGGHVVCGTMVVRVSTLYSREDRIQVLQELVDCLSE
jgi:hypothetical protein